MAVFSYARLNFRVPLPRDMMLIKRGDASVPSGAVILTLLTPNARLFPPSVVAVCNATLQLRDVR